MNLKIDENGDLIVERYGLKRITNLEQTAQRIRTRLNMFRGEYFLDENIGMPWFESILRKNPRADTVKSVFKQTILTTPSVLELKDFSITDGNIRNLQVQFKVTAEEGDIVENIEV